MSDETGSDFAARYWRSAPAAGVVLPVLSSSSLDDATTFRALADNIPTLCWVANGDGFIVWFNRRWHEYCGSTPASMEGWGWTSTHDPERLPEVMRRWQAALATGEPFEMTVPLRGADGLFRPFLTRVQPMRDASGRVARWFGVNTEISAQLAAERALGTARDMSRDVLENMGEAFSLLDAEFRIRAVNAEALRLETRPRDHILGKTHWEAYPGSEQSAIGQLYKQAMATRTPVALEHRYVWEDGRSAWLDMRAYPVAEGLAIFYRDVSDRKRIEGERDQADDILQTFLQVVPGVVYAKDREGRILVANQGTADLLGKPRSEFIGKTDAEVLDDKAQAAVIAATDRRVMESGRTEVLEEAVSLPDGTPAIWLSTKSPLRDSQGAVIGLIGSSLDITDQVKARDILARSREVLERAVAMRTAERDRLWQSSQDLLLVARFDTTMVAVNPAWTRVLGWTEAELVGASFMALIHPDDRAASEAEASMLSAEGRTTMQFENRFRAKSGEWVWLSWAVTSDAEHFNAVARDVTAERRAKEALKLAESRIRAVFDTTDQFQAFLDPKGTLLHANPAALAAIGKRPEDVLGRPFWDTPWFTGTPGMASLMAGAVSAAAGGTLVREEVAIRLPSGVRSFDFAIRPVVDPTGEVVGIVPEAAETTQRRQIEDALRQAQKMEAVGQLTGGIAHDFNNMLAVVIGSLDLLQRRIDGGDSRSRRYLDAATDGARRAALLTQRLLAFSRQQPLQPEPVDANRLVAGMSDLLQHSLGGDTRLETVLAGGLWRTYADPNQLENAILNLAVNGRDAMPEGGRITIETQNAHLDERYVAAHLGVQAGQYVLVAISDTGAGMTPDVIAKAFDPFFTTKEVGRGTGLGLSQVYGFVKQSGGHVKIYSEPAQGTVVKLYLPRYAGSDGSAAGAAASPGLLTGDERDVILVVEDEPAVRQFSVDALGELGYRVLEADGAAAALRILESRPDVSLLFTDIVMPEVNGARLAAEVRRRWPGLKILFTTGYTRNAIVHNGVLDAGVDLISKPFTMEALAAKVREVLDLTRSSGPA